MRPLIVTLLLSLYLSVTAGAQAQSNTLRAQINSHFRQAGLSACVDNQV